jgi:hypothetical protein
MMTEIPMLAPVALMSDLPKEGLTRGQLGTVVERLGAESDPVYLVEFADDFGRAYAFSELRPEQLMVLHRRENEAA